jgi:hypothetical protein
METIKSIIIEIYENKSKSFKKRLLKDFLKEKVILHDNKNRDIMLSKILSDMIANNINIRTIDKPINLIEETLFQHLISSK